MRFTWVFFLLSFSFLVYCQTYFTCARFDWGECRLMIIVLQVNDEIKDEVGNTVNVVKVVSPETGIHVCPPFPKMRYGSA